MKSFVKFGHETQSLQYKNIHCILYEVLRFNLSTYLLVHGTLTFHQAQGGLMTWSQYELSQIRVLSLCIHLLSLSRIPQFLTSPSQTSLQILSQNKTKTYSFRLLLLGFSFKASRKVMNIKLALRRRVAIVIFLYSLSFWN